MLSKLLKRDIGFTTGLGNNETTGISIYDWAKMFSPGSRAVYNGNYYQAFKQSGGGPGGDTIASNAVVFALTAVRVLLFSEVRFQWQQMRNGKPGDLFGNNDLDILENPWAGATTRDLLARAELDATSTGQSYWVKNRGELQWLDPTKMKILTSAVTDDQFTNYRIGERLEAYVYYEKPDTPVIYPASEVCHYKPFPDPNNRFLGMSWLSPCLPDVATDDIITTHKQATIGNGGSLSYVVTMDPNTSKEQFEGFVDKFRREHEGPQNASKTLFLGGGMDVKTVGQTFENLALQATQGSGEVRIAAAAGIAPAIVGFSEGLKGSTLNAGNYGEARRRMADGTFRPLWGTFANAMSSLLPVPSRSRLWFDDSEVAFLREDLADQAEIDATNAKTVLTLIQAGYEPDAAVQVVLARDFSRLLGQHTGLTSVQLQPPQTEPSDPIKGPMPAMPPADMPADMPAMNGKQPTPA